MQEYLTHKHLDELLIKIFSTLGALIIKEKVNEIREEYWEDEGNHYIQNRYLKRN